MALPLGRSGHRTVRELGDTTNRRGFSHCSASKTQRGRSIWSLPLSSCEASTVLCKVFPHQTVTRANICGERGRQRSWKFSPCPQRSPLLPNHQERRWAEATSRASAGQPRGWSLLGGSRSRGGLGSGESNMNKLGLERTSWRACSPQRSSQSLYPRWLCPETTPHHTHTHTLCPTQNRGAPGKLTFGFIVPRTLQMADLVNTCRAHVPPLPSLLPLPTLKS